MNNVFFIGFYAKKMNFDSKSEHERFQSNNKSHLLNVFSETLQANIVFHRSIFNQILLFRKFIIHHYFEAD